MRNHTGPIRFYNRGEPYYEFTNFYEAVVKIDGEDWLTTEHYFQAQKFVGTPLVGTIRMLERPREAFEKSRDPRYSPWRRSDWEKVKEDVMYKALQAKFTQHEGLGQMLRETRDRYLIEHSPYDSYWGDGGDGSGKNRLGVLLMRLRKDMKPKQPIRAPSPPAPIHTIPQPQHDTGGSKHLSPDYSPERDCSKQEDDLAPQPSAPSATQPNLDGQQQNDNFKSKSSPDPPNLHPVGQASSTTVSSNNTQPSSERSMSYASAVTSNTSASSTAASQQILSAPVPLSTPQVTTHFGNTESNISASGLQSTANSTNLIGEYVNPVSNQYIRNPLTGYRHPSEATYGQQLNTPPATESQTDPVPMEH